MIEVKIVDEELKKQLENTIINFDSSIQRALYDTMRFVQQDSEQEQILPYDTGNLQNSRKIYVQDKGDEIAAYLSHDNAPYSIYIYEGTRHGVPLNFQTKHNAHAQARWYKDYAGGSKEDEVIRYFEKSLAKNTDNLI